MNFLSKKNFIKVSHQITCQVRDKFLNQIEDRVGDKISQELFDYMNSMCNQKFEVIYMGLSDQVFNRASIQIHTIHTQVRTQISVKLKENITI